MNVAKEKSSALCSGAPVLLLGVYAGVRAQNSTVRSLQAAGGRRQAAGGRRQAAGGRRQAAGGRRLKEFSPVGQ